MNKIILSIFLFFIFSILCLFPVNKVLAQTESGNEINRNYASNSLLSSGKWHKIKIDTSGVFKLTYEQLKQIGLSNPQNVRLYSYGGKQLPYNNSSENYDDMHEIPIWMSSESSSDFSNGDYILFYGEGPVTWEYDNDLMMYKHHIHCYTNYTYIFLTDQFKTGGLRIKKLDNTNLTASKTITSTDSYQYHEDDKYNALHTGRTWYSSILKPNESVLFNFNFPNIISNDDIKLKTVVVGRKKYAESCYFNIKINESKTFKIDVDKKYGDHEYGKKYEKNILIENPNPLNAIEFKLYGATTDMEGVIDYVLLNAREKLKIINSQLKFSDITSVDSGSVCQLNVDNNGKDIRIWNITNSTNPIEMVVSKRANTSSFKHDVSLLNYFIAFDGSGFLSPILEGDDVGAIANQNLHGIGSVDMIIVTHPLFKKHADSLAKIHRKKDNLKVYVTEPQFIYNEFSSGTQDVSAIRNFMRMLYKRNGLKYLLLFGDGTYDNKGIKNQEANFIPTYQSESSLYEISSFVSDDFYGLLDDDEGEILSRGSKKLYGHLDIGIGRFPVENDDEADVMLDKVVHYMSPNTLGNWRTNICLIGDDQDYGKHMNDPEEIDRTVLRTNYPAYNVNKIFIDAYKQISLPSGQSYPDATKAIYGAIDKGSLIIDYVGHGSPRILTSEEILTVSDIRSWNNINKLPIFVTASCEVGRFDDHSKKTLGEWFVIHPDGGGIAAITTTRVVFSDSNHKLNTAFFNNALNYNNRLGDVVRLSKNTLSKSETNNRNFTLLGDPALKLAIPKNKIIVGNINNNVLSKKSVDYEQVTYEPGDTVHALTKTLIEGYVDDIDGNPINDSGILYITIFDKTDTLYTKGHDRDGAVVDFIIQDKILYKGKASITDGIFSFEFIIPKDISFKYGRGKISLYAVFDSIDAIGYSDNIIIGGSSEEFETDDNGPVVELFMNDYGFKSGSTTDENPVLLAKLTDEYGINTTGNGFGHNITAILDDDQDNVYILNNYYEGYLDQYNGGEVRFPFRNLEPGYHKVNFKVWDIYNNSSESEIEFYVHNGDNMVLENLKNIPNPFYDETEFTFDHNQSNDYFDINISIFNYMGSKVTEINEINSNTGYKATPISWDGTSSSGAKLPNGIYIYRVAITTTDGKKINKSSKLMIFK